MKKMQTHCMLELQYQICTIFNWMQSIVFLLKVPISIDGVIWAMQTPLIHFIVIISKKIYICNSVFGFHCAISLIFIIKNNKNISKWVYYTRLSFSSELQCKRTWKSNSFVRDKIKSVQLAWIGNHWKVVQIPPNRN